MKNPKVFIIVLHFGEPKNTEECLKSLENLEYDNFETIVIDNTKDNRGFAGGNNIGIKQALEKGTDYVLLLNNDTIVKPGFLKKLVEAGEKDDKIGILGPVIKEYGSDKIHFVGGKINWLFTKGIHILSHPDVMSGNQPFQPSSASPSETGRATINEVDYITGACLLIKREVIEKIGLMPEDYFFYCEDVDWCLKARKAGYKCIIVPTAKIWHKVSSSAKAESFSYIYYHVRNGLLLAKKNAPFFIKILAYLNSFLVYGKQIIKLIILPSKNKWSKAIMLGIEDFYKRKFGKYENWH